MVDVEIKRGNVVIVDGQPPTPAVVLDAVPSQDPSRTYVAPIVQEIPFPGILGEPVFITPGLFIGASSTIWGIDRTVEALRRGWAANNPNFLSSFRQALRRGNQHARIIKI